VTTGGVAYCWGANSGVLGNGTFRASTTPVAVSGGLTFAAVSAGDDHACGVTTAGAAYCWGGNILGELGNGTFTISPTPVAVSGGLTFAALSAGAGFSTCGVTTAGAAYCWGDKTYGELGNGGTVINTTPPVRVW
jgi:alpha-tubulin suppressor-like RCC1 family protein